MDLFGGFVAGRRCAQLGLSRRRSRVRVPSLPSKSLQIEIFCCPLRRKATAGFRNPAYIPHQRGLTTYAALRRDLARDDQHVDREVLRCPAFGRRASHYLSERWAELLLHEALEGLL